LEKVSETCTPAKREAKRPSHSAKIDGVHMDVERRKVKVRAKMRAIRDRSSDDVSARDDT
jgi:hypothetical protein